MSTDSHQDEKEVNIDISIIAFESLPKASTPANLLPTLINPSGAHVVTPEGKLYTIFGHPEYTKRMAEAYAKENNNISFDPTKIMDKLNGEPSPKFLFKDFVRALMYLAPNAIIAANEKDSASGKTAEREKANKLVELVKKAKNETSLIPDSDYLDNVKPITAYSNSSGSEKVYGVEGQILEVKGYKKTIRIVNLTLAFSNYFGIENFDVIGRKLSAEFPFESNLDKILMASVKEIARENNMDFVYNSENGNAPSAKLIYQSPTPHFAKNANQRMPYPQPVMSTSEMLQLLYPVADGIQNYDLSLQKKLRAEQLSEMNEHKEKLRKEIGTK